MEAAETSWPPLDYAPKPPVHRRRNFGRAVWLLAFLAVAWVAWRWGPPYAPRVWYLYWQRQCMNFSAPVDHVAYEEDESRAAALSDRAGYQSMPLRPPAATQPRMEPAGFVPPPLVRLRGSKRATVFLGRLTSAGGQERLVAVELHVGLISSNGDRGLQLMPWTATLASLRRPPLGSGSKYARFNLARIYRLRLFWGQRDPQHADRFTIRYIINGHPGVIEGRLDEQGSLKLTVLEGPLAARRERS